MIRTMFSQKGNDEKCGEKFKIFSDIKLINNVGIKNQL